LLTIASRYTTEPGIIEEWTEKQQESSMIEEQRKKIDRIVALAERLYPNFDYADMAYDAVMENPDCDEQRVADRLAMAFAFP